MTILEGIRRSQEGLKGIPSDPDRIATHLRSWRMSRQAKPIAVRFLQECMDEIAISHQQFRKRFDAIDWSVNLQWEAFSSFNAEASGDFEIRKYDIAIAIEAPPSLLSMAHELSLANEINHRGMWKRLWSRMQFKATSMDRWLRGVTDKAAISPDVATWAKDACFLLYFHELSHVSMGHLSVESEDPIHKRALEFDADFNAGSYFSATMLSANSTIDSIVQRLTRASLLLASAFKVVSKLTDNYHYPTVRSVAFMQGGFFYLDSHLRLAGARQVQWEAMASQSVDRFKAAMRASSLYRYAGDESTLALDLVALETQTAPAREALANGPMKEHSVRAFLA